jgi:hypothetical protein
MAQADAKRARAERFGGTCRVERGGGTHLRADQARVGRPAHEAESDGDVARARSEDRGERDREKDAREGEEDVGDAREQLVDGRSTVARDRAERGADGNRSERRDERDRQRQARTEEEASENVATESVGAERVEHRWPGEARGEVLVERVVGAEEGGEESSRNDRGERRRAGDQRQRDRPVLSSRRPDIGRHGLDGGTRGDLCERRHRRSRGSIHA